MTAEQKISGRGEALIALVLFLLLSVGTLAVSAQGGSSGGGSGSGAVTQDKNDTDPAEIRDNYLKRFPFAKEAANSDRVQNQESGEGSNETFSKALDSVTTKCDFFTESRGVGDIHYQQQTQQGSVETASKRDGEVTKNTVNTYGLPMSDTQFQVIDRENRQRLLEMAFDPERWVWSNEATDQLMASSASNSVGGAAQTAFKGAFDAINTVLINVANENAAAPGGGAGGRTIPQAVYLVLQFYHRFFIPLAIILLLPGALLTQLKGMIGFGFLGGDEDAVTPVDGIIRAVIAVFLIPATQLIMSYSIDIGNVLTETVRDPAKNWINEQTIMNWAREQMFVAPPDKANNAIVTFGGGGAGLNGGAGGGAGGAGGAGGGAQSGGGNQSGQGGQSGGFSFNFNIFGPQGAPTSNQVINQILQFFFGPFAGGQNQGGVPAGGGKAAGQPSSATVQENQLFLSTAMQLGFNSASYLMSYGLTVLTAYQLVFMCYLLLMGPIAAAFFAWPSGVGSLFRKVFSNWLNAVIVLSLWRFYWCIILACMTQRIVYLQESGGFNPNSPSEMMIFNCFMALLVYVPFQPFNFNPGEAVSSVLDKAGQGGGGGGGGQGGPGATAGGSEVEHGGKSAPQHGAVRRGGVATKEFVSVAVRGFTAVQSAFSGGKGAAEGLTGSDSSPPAAGDRSISSAGGERSAPPTSVGSHSGSPVQGQGQQQALPPSTGSQDGVSSPAGEFASMPMETLSPGSPPVVPLVPSADGGGGGQRYLIATNDVNHVGPAIQAWQQAVGSVPSSQADAGAPSAQSQPLSGSAGNLPGGGAMPPAGPAGGGTGGVAQKNLAGNSGSPLSGSSQPSSGGQGLTGQPGQPGQSAAGGQSLPGGNPGNPPGTGSTLPPTTNSPPLPPSADGPPPGSNPPPTDPPKTT